MSSANDVDAKYYIGEALRGSYADGAVKALIALAYAVLSVADALREK